MIKKGKLISIVLGPLIFLLMEIIGKPASMSMEAYHVLAGTLWISIWWVTEAVPLAATALVPIIVFPLTGALDITETTSSFGHKYIFLYLGGFIIAIAIEKWHLHKRIALYIINIIGSNISRIILGFMMATAFLSMWISNTATSVMMLPIGMAIVSQFKKDTGDLIGDSFGKALMLAIAYSASIGGVATLIGTPPNLVLAGILEELYGVKITFMQWVSFGFPVSAILVFICWKYLTKSAFNFDKVEFPGGKEEISRMLHALGRISFEEKMVLLVFVFTAILWMLRSLIEKAIPGIDDTVIAVFSAIILFVLPSSDQSERLVTWEDTKKVPWGIMILFGGGLAIAKGFTTSGLAEWIATRLAQLDGLYLILLILILVAVVNFLTEITSNLATTAMLLPVLAPMALTFNLHPYMIMVSVTIAASCAFMLPVATPPNAVVFGSGYLRIPDMMKSGIFMNIVSILFITIVTYLLLPLLWGFNPTQFPEAFIKK